MCDRIAIIQAGKIRAIGTMDDLRKNAESGATGLEEIFLRLTGEQSARQAAEVLNV
jgi:ABC-type multidrug transport system ATPase subunit